MTREELQAVVEAVLGMHTTPDRIDTIMRAADAYTAHDQDWAAEREQIRLHAEASKFTLHRPGDGLCVDMDIEVVPFLLLLEAL
jgi:hypothetical protein